MMLSKTLILAIAAVFPALTACAPQNPGRPGGPGRPGRPGGPGRPGNPIDPADPLPAEFVFNIPTLEPFIHINGNTDNPANTTTLTGVSARAPNVGGNFTGAIEGSVVAVGASIEHILNTTPDRGYYSNQATLNTTSGVTLIIEITGKLFFANEAVHAFGDAKFSAPPGEFEDLNWRSFAVEMMADFGTGEGFYDLFELVTAGRIDGEPIDALLPPGEA